jgi:hypothetical protein
MIRQSSIFIFFGALLAFLVDELYPIIFDECAAEHSLIRCMHVGGVCITSRFVRRVESALVGCPQWLRFAYPCVCNPLDTTPSPELLNRYLTSASAHALKILMSALYSMALHSRHVHSIICSSKTALKI